MREAERGAKKKLTAAFRWAFRTAEAASPFKCEDCGEEDKENRNCFNRRGLSEDARAVEEWTDEVKEELKEKKAGKVFSLGNLRFYECPLSFIETDTWALIRLVFLLDGTGHLLHEGGLGGQPHWLVEAYEIYKAELSRYLSSIKQKNS